MALGIRFLMILLCVLQTDSSLTEIDTTEAPDVVYVIVSKTTEDGTKCTLPSDVTVTVTIGSDVIQLNLRKNDDISTQAQTYLIKTSATGSVSLEPYSVQQEENYGLYKDKNNSASIMLICSKKEKTSAEVRGTFQYRNRIYRLTRANDRQDRVSGSAGKGEEYRLVPQRRPVSGSSDYRQPHAGTRPLQVRHEQFVTSANPSAPLRKKRQSTQYYIDVIAVIDYAVYMDWYNRANASLPQTRANQAITGLRQYFALTFNAVDLLYHGITSLPYQINIRLIGYVIAQTSASAPWTENIRLASSTGYMVNADSTLSTFKEWVTKPGVMPAYDHAVLFSGYDLFSLVNGRPNTAITGLAYIGSMCYTTGESVSLVEETGGFQSVFTVAHEIGHSLGAQHDGTSNACSSSSGYLLSSVFDAGVTSMALNAWKFSTCSVSSFRSFINGMLQDSRGRACLTTALTSTVPDVSGLLPGQIYDPNAQCQQIYGNQARVCLGISSSSASSICTEMYCQSPMNSSLCSRHTAARGTSCGNKRWCIDGQCVYDAKAPRKNPDCVFGDELGLVFDGQPCSTFVRNFTGYCYQEVIQKRCCSSCQASYIPLSNCIYGDKTLGCSQAVCQFHYEDCCGTCNYGTPILPTTTSFDSGDDYQPDNNNNNNNNNNSPGTAVTVTSSAFILLTGFTTILIGLLS